MRTSPEPFRPTVTRYVDADGRRVSAATPGAIRVVEESRTWYAKIGGKKVCLKTEDHGQAWARLRDLLRHREEHAAGIRDTYTDEAERPIAEHIAEWLEAVEANGTGQDQLDLLAVRVKHLAALAGWKRVPDITPETCLAALAKLQRGQNLSAQTRNHYLSHAKQFARFLWENKRLRDHPLLRLRKVKVEADRRHDRRVPTDDEVQRLFWSARRQPDRLGMTGQQRMLGYQVAMAAGLRAMELRSLTRESFDLDAATVTVRAAYDKRRRKVTQPLPPWLVEELRAWFAAGGQTWGAFPKDFPGRILQADLKTAGVAYKTDGPDGPLFLDFHSLRSWYISALANQPNISPKTLMTLCRHSTADLTMRVYAKARLADCQAAVDLLPSPNVPKRTQSDAG